jgi:hypothetical protein
MLFFVTKLNQNTSFSKNELVVASLTFKKLYEKKEPKSSSLLSASVHHILRVRTGSISRLNVTPGSGHADTFAVIARTVTVIAAQITVGTVADLVGT